MLAKRLARSTNSHLCIFSTNLVDIGGIPSDITDEEVLGLSDEGSFIQPPRSFNDGRVGVALIRVGSVGSSGKLICPAPVEG